MSKKGTPLKILRELDQHLKSSEFKLSEQDRSFIRKTEFGFQRISFIGRSPSKGQVETGLPLYEAFVILGIRYNSIEEKMLPLKLVLGKVNQKKTTTLFRPVQGAYPFKRFRDKLIKIGYKHTERDITKAVDRMQKMLNSDGLFWFDKYSNLTTAEAELNSAPFWKASNLVNNAETRIYTGVCAAAICKGKSHALEVAQSYLGAVRKDNNISSTVRSRIEEKIAIISQQF